MSRAVSSSSVVPFHGRDEAQRVPARVRADERRALDADTERLFHEPVEERLVRVVPEIRDEHRDGLGDRRRRRGRARRPPADAGQDDDEHGGQRRNRDPGAGRRGRTGAGELMAVGRQAVEIRDELGGRRIAGIGRGLQASGDDAFERLRDRRVDRPERRRTVLHAAHQLGHRIVPGRDPLTADQRVVHQQPERVDVGAVIDRLPLRLFRRHVFERPDHGAERGRGAGAGAADRSRDPEIHDQRAIVGRDHDVLGLQIAVDDADLVGRLQPGRDLFRDRQRLGHGQLSLPPQPVGEVLPFDKRHREVLDAVELAEIVDPDDVFVGDLAGQDELALEAALDLAGGLDVVEDLGADDFERHRHAELRVPRLIDDAHAAGAEDADDVVARPEGLPRGQRPGHEGSTHGRRGRTKSGSGCRV